MSYAVGDRVRARPGDPDQHSRVPRYVRGQAGEVVALLGDWVLPASSVAGLAAAEPCYAVRFAAVDLFGSGDHTVTVDLWESYLERA
jgi:nitrile hydratase